MLGADAVQAALENLPDGEYYIAERQPFGRMFVKSRAVDALKHKCSGEIVHRSRSHVVGRLDAQTPRLVMYATPLHHDQDTTIKETFGLYGDGRHWHRIVIAERFHIVIERTAQTAEEAESLAAHDLKAASRLLAELAPASNRASA